METKVLGIRPPEHPAFPSHVQWTGSNQMLSPPEVAAVIERGDALNLKPGTIGNGGMGTDTPHRDDTYRRVETGSLLGDDLDWLYQRVLDKMQLANDAHYRFNMVGLAEPIGYLKYSAVQAEGEEPGHYKWHQDFGGGLYSTRKLSMVIQLSDPSTYTGCRLQLCNDGPWESNYLQPGDAIMFPSWTPHAVSNIESGVRRCLVIWFAGPQFK